MELMVLFFVQLLLLTKILSTTQLQLKLFQELGVCLNNIDVEYAPKKGTAVLHAPKTNITATAEHTVGLMFALTSYWDNYKRGGRVSSVIDASNVISFLNRGETKIQRKS